MRDVKPYEPLVVLALSAICAWLAYEITGAITMHGTSGYAIEMGLAEWPARLISNPFGSYREPVAMMLGIIGFVVPLAAWAVIASNRGNFDPGKEHGDARVATEREMQRLRDTDTLTNNLVFTQNSSLVFNPSKPQHYRALDGRNHNVCCLGTSGSGKTRYVSKPQIMNSIGSALADQADFPSQHPETNTDEGYDIFVTDPKGDTLRDCGWMLAKAGVDVKVFDTINFRNSLRFNPLAYIDMYETDVVSDPQSELTYTARVYVDGKLAHVLEPTEGLASCISNFALEDSGDERYYVAIRPIVHSDPVSAVSSWANADDDEKRDPLSSVFDDAKVADDLASVVYQNSTVEFDVEFYHKEPYKRTIVIEVDIDRRLVPMRDVTDAGVRVVRRAPDDETLTCRLSIPHARRLSPKNRLHYRYSLACHVKTRNVADGVSLTSMIDVLVENLGAKREGPGSDDPFWDDAKRLLFMAIISYIIERFGRGWCNLPTVLDYLDLAKVSFDGSIASPLDFSFENWETGYRTEVGGNRDEPALGECGMPVDTFVPAVVPTGFGPHPANKSLAVHCYRAFKQGAPETLQSVIISCQAALTKLVSEEVRWLLEVDEMRIDTLGNPNQKQAIFAISSDSNPTFEFLLAIMEYLAVNNACDRARALYGGRLPRRVHFILDEFANIGKLPAFDRVMATVRSRNISVCLFIQSLKQFDKVYGAVEGAIILDCCATLMYLGGQAMDTLEMLSDLMGEETVDEVNSSKTYGMRGSASASRQSHARKLATVSQLRRTPTNQAWVMIIGMHPFKDHKAITARHPYFKFMSGFREPGDPECVLPPFSWSSYKRYLSGEIALPERLEVGK